jgi:adenylosuccinate synthase
VAAALANDYECHVRVGGANAGHSFYHDEQKFIARSIPVGWTNPDASLFIGPGAVIDPDVLRDELSTIEDAGYSVKNRLLIDNRAVMISRSQHLAEGGVSGKAHAQIGSTGEGVGLARMAKINRDTLISTDTAPYTCIRVADETPFFESLGIQTGDTADLLHRHLRDGSKIMLEGAQGCGLSLTLGDWPHVTSADTNAAQLASDAGISPSDVSHSILVARTYPIRVAGPSGPLYNETSWEELGLEPEITTVTKKVRRVGHWNPEQVRYACQVNYPALLVVTFIDYLWPETKGVVNWRSLPETALEWIKEQEELIEAPIVAVGTGPDSYCPLKLQASALGIPVYVKSEA